MNICCVCFEMSKKSVNQLQGKWNKAENPFSRDASKISSVQSHLMNSENEDRTKQRLIESESLYR